MKAYRLFFKPDRAVPQFKRLRFEEVEVPLRDVFMKGCHPVGACHYRGSPKRDTSHAAEAVVNKLNEDDARVAALVTSGSDFGYSHDHGTATDCLSLNRCPDSVVRRPWRPWRLGGEGRVVWQQN